MLDNGGDSVVLVSTIPSPFIVADDLAHQPPSSAVAVPRSTGPGQPAALTDDRPVPSPDDCSEITSTVADDPTTSATVRSPSAASPSPPLDSWKEHTTAAIGNTGPMPPAASSPVTCSAETFKPVITSMSVTTTTTTTSQLAGRQKKSLEMVVDLLKRPSTSTKSSPSSSTATICAAAANAPSLPVVTSSSVVPTSGHVLLNGGACSTADDEAIRQALLQRLVPTPSPAYRQLPAPPSSHFRFRSVTGNGPMPVARMESGPPIKQLKHMCKNVRSFVPSGPRRPSQWRHPALDLLFGPPPVPATRHHAAMQFPPRVPGGAYRGACVRSQQAFARPPRFRAPSAHLATSAASVSLDRRQQGNGEQLSALMRVLLEASGNSCHGNHAPTPSSSSSSSSSYPSSAELWKAAIN